MANRAEMKEFLKEHPFSPETMERILKRFELNNIDLSVEKIRIEEKKSILSRRQRDAVMELSLVKEIMEELEKEKKITEEIKETVNFDTN